VLQQWSLRRVRFFWVPTAEVAVRGDGALGAEAGMGDALGCAVVALLE